MSFINYMAREINCKLVYYGPGLCGKTTNSSTSTTERIPSNKQDDIARDGNERTLFFDFLPCRSARSADSRHGFTFIRSGSGVLRRLRKLILKGVDGVIFVADSQIERSEANEESIENLRTNLSEQGYSSTNFRSSSSIISEICRTWLRPKSESAPQ